MTKTKAISRLDKRTGVDALRKKVRQVAPLVKETVGESIHYSSGQRWFPDSGKRLDEYVWNVQPPANQREWYRRACPRAQNDVRPLSPQDLPGFMKIPK